MEGRGDSRYTLSPTPLILAEPLKRHSRVHRQKSLQCRQAISPLHESELETKRKNIECGVNVLLISVSLPFMDLIRIRNPD